MKSGNSQRQTALRDQLGKRDRSILADVLLYRLITNEIVGARHLPGLSANAVTKVTARLVRDKWLQSHSLFEKCVYFGPGKSCARQYGLPASRVLPFGTQALASHLSIASYCLEPSKQYQLLSTHQFTNSWSWIPQKLRILPHAVQQSEDKLQLRILRVDLGGTPVHVATKCNQDINLRREVTGYAQLLADRKLVYVVLTSTDSKKQAIMLALQKRRWPVNTRFEVAVIPALCRLLSH